ncbi:hypothetical protein L1987_19454 [Smallanthus sonchifolius]|uniref:Uncharacterized protein n=1 Tax=Smallanthus sonchifolius TaxID=185202 RepID=A0ACB9IPW1_9ASTR|nr:hypothetical protein L1987_19454 [Smallanthus sonchifolius]
MHKTGKTSLEHGEIKGIYHLAQDYLHTVYKVHPRFASFSSSYSYSRLAIPFFIIYQFHVQRQNTDT